MKMIARDYFNAFRISRIKANLGNNFWGNTYLFAYTFGILPLANIQKWELDAIGWFQYFAVAFLVLYGMFAAMVHPLDLPKIMHLCPMSEKERRSYLEGVYRFKVGSTMLLAVVGVAVLMVFTGLRMRYGVFVILAECGIAVCMGSLDGKRARSCADEKKSIIMYAGKSVWDTCAVFLSMGIGWFIVFGVQWQADFEGTVGMVLIILMLAVELPLVVRILKNLPSALDEAARYEV